MLDSYDAEQDAASSPNVTSPPALRSQLWPADRPQITGQTRQAEIAQDAAGPSVVLGGNGFGRGRERRTLAVFRRSLLAHALDADTATEGSEPLRKGASEPPTGAGDKG